MRYRMLFPRVSRSFAAQRWLDVVLRTLHLVGLAGVGGSFLQPSIDPGGQLFLPLTLGSGCVMVLLSLWSNGIWLVQLRGQAILLKLLLLLLIPLIPDLGAELFIVVIVISGLISHAPAKTRYYSLYHRRQIDQL